MKAFLFGCGSRDAKASAAILVMRLGIGLMMLIGHGIPKIQKFDGLSKGFFTPDFFPLQWMSSTVSLVACIAAEVGAAALIIIGLSTRPAAFVLGFTMAVAAFARHADSVWFYGPKVQGFKELAILYLIPMIVLLVSGAGRYSLDALIGKERRGRLKIAI